MDKLLQILVAEDNSGDVFLIREALSKHNVEHELHVVRDGEEALRFIEGIGNGQPCPDVFLLDLNLPRVEGDEVLQRFRQHPQCAQTPVIVVTSSDAPKDHERVSRIGITSYFRKPTDLEDFMKLGEVVKAFG